MTGAASELQTAIRAMLNGDALLTSLLGGQRVYDGAPRDAAVPFVSIDEITTKRADGIGAAIEDHRLTLRGWSKAGGKVEALRIADRVLALLDDAAPAMATHRVIRMTLEASDTRAARDRVAVEAMLRFRVLTETTG